MASMASLSVSVRSSRSGIEFTLAGYNHKLHKLLEQVLATVTSFNESVEESLFERLKDKLLKQMKNFAFSATYSLTSQATDLTLGPTAFSVTDRIEAMEGLTLDDLKMFSKQVRAGRASWPSARVLILTSPL
jgi:insulysin